MRRIQRYVEELKSQSNDFSQFVGMWEGRETTQETLRKQAWK